MKKINPYKQEVFYDCSFSKLTLTNDKSNIKSYKNYYQANPKNKFNIHRLKKHIIDKVKYLHISNHSFIAGGYILGIVIEYFKMGTNQSRDIDIFQFLDIGDNKTQKLIEQSPLKDADLYKFFVKGENYEIISQEKEEHLNIMNVITSDIFSWEQIIKDFDLNCVKIGVLKENDKFQVYIDPEFYDFLNSKEIIITSASSFNSLARAIRKKEQYPFLSFDQNFFSKRLFISSTKFLKEKKVNLKNYSISNENIKLLSQLNNSVWSISKNNLVHEIEDDDVCLFNEFKEYFYHKAQPLLKKSTKERIRYFQKKINTKNYPRNNLIKNTILYNKLLEKDFNKNKYERLIKYIDNHSLYIQFTNFFETNDYNLDLGYRLVKTLKENVHLLVFLENNEQITINSIKNLFQKYREYIKRQTNFKYKPLHSLLWFEKYIHELNSNQMLREESKKMKHCVAGYWTRIARGEERIFHMTLNNHHSTFSINKDGKISQHQAYNNSRPIKIHISLAKMFEKNYKYLIK